MTFAEYATAMKFRDVLGIVVEGIVDKIRPAYKYATVQSIDHTHSRCLVRFLGESVDADVAMGAIQPTSVGQTVRVEGMTGDRFIADVLNATAPWNTAWGEVAHVEVSPTTTGITSEVDIAGANCSWVAPANRLYRVDWRVSALSTNAGDQWYSSLQLDGVGIPNSSFNTGQPVSSWGHQLFGWVRLSGVAAGTRTVKARIARDTGTGTISLQACEIQVTDIGPL